jgi:hypothetical protein
MIVRMYTGPDGESHFEELSPAYVPDGPSDRAPWQDAKSISFSRQPPGRFMDWHPAPRRQYVISLQGQVEIGLGDGTKRVFGPGDVLLAEDMTGHGHTTRVVGDEIRISATVPLTDEAK